VVAAVQQLLGHNVSEPQKIADSLLAQAVALDQGRPRDDITVLVVTVSDRLGDDVRRMNVRLPL
jgi:serine phosphatase RsbU (regulator of sigma subunit)